MTILSGPQIRDEIGWGTIEVDPYDEKRVQPNSVDLTLGKQVRVYKNFVGQTLKRPTWWGSREVSSNLWADVPKYTGVTDVYPFLDSQTKNETYDFEIDVSGWVLKPGILYLMHTAERIHTKKFVTQLNGKSSIARLGVIVHFTAAYGETGFNGQYTLEVSCVHPVRLHLGMAIAQAVFYNVYGQMEDYQKKGHYTGSAALGAEPSHSWEQFDANQHLAHRKEG